MHVLPDISRNKGNQIIKCVQLIEYSMKIIFFFEKSWAKYGGETIPRPFWKY